MKRIIAACAATVYCVTSLAQVQLDRAIQLTGSGNDAKISGIQDVSHPNDAVNAEVVQSNSLSFAQASGSVNAYEIYLNPAPDSYIMGMPFHFIANNANTGSATLNVNNLGAVTIRKNFNVTLSEGDIKNGQLVSVMYDGSGFQMISQLGSSVSAVPHGKQLFTTNGTFTVPPGVSTIWVSMCGGGGGGGAGSSAKGGGGGGGGGASYLANQLNNVSGNYAVVIGSGGTAGSPGTSTSFGNLLTAAGGQPGVAGSNLGGNGGAAGGAGGTDGSGASGVSNQSWGAGGTGGGTIFGAGGGGGSTAAGSGGSTGGLYGAGGGGGGGGLTPGTGGSGAPGMVLVEW